MPLYPPARSTILASIQTANTLAYAASQVIDFDAATFQILTLTGNVTISTTNRGGATRGKEVWLRLVAGAANRVVTFDPDIVVVGPTLISLAAGKTAEVHLSSYGSAETATIVQVPAQSTAGGVGTLALDSANYAVQKTDPRVVITVQRGGALAQAVSVDYATADGTAAAGVNYTGTSGTLSWGAGDGSPKTITVPIIDDAGQVTNKSFTVALSNPTFAELGTPATANVAVVTSGTSLIPLMDDYTSPSGVASVSNPEYVWGDYTYAAWRAMDGNLANTIFTAFAIDVQDLAFASTWLRYAFAGTATAVSYKIWPTGTQYDGSNPAPKSWVLEASNDGSSWTTLDTQTNVTAWTEGTPFSQAFVNVTAYKYYRLRFTAYNGIQFLQFAQWQLF